MRKFKIIQEEIAAKSKHLKAIFDEAGEDRDFTKITLIEGDTKAKVEEVQRLSTELEALTKEAEEAKAIDVVAKRADDLHQKYNVAVAGMPHPEGDAQPQRAEYKSVGKLIMEKKDLLKPNGSPFHIDFDVKTLWLPDAAKTAFTTSAGWAPESIRIPGAVLSPARALVVTDYIPQFPTSQAAVVYMLETTATFNAAEKAEAAAYAESAFALTETTETVRKVTTSLPVTDEQLDDVEAAEAYINQRLGYDVRRRLDLQVLEGDGNAPNLKGTLNIGGSLQTQAKGTDSVPDAIYKAMDLTRTAGFAEPSVLFINPSDWQPVRLLTTADGIYIFGSPMAADPLMIWGKPVVATTAVTANTAITGDYTGYSALYVRKGLEISMGYVNDDFTKGKKTIRADMRCAMVHFRTAAFATITGI